MEDSQGLPLRHGRRSAGSLLTDSIAALVSSSAFTAAFYPFHRIKILLQTQDVNPLVVSGKHTAAHGTFRAEFTESDDAAVLWLHAWTNQCTSTRFAAKYYRHVALQQRLLWLAFPGQVKPYTFATAVPRLLREGGVANLWRGNAAYMLRHVPSTTLSFAFKDLLLRKLPHYDASTQLGAAASVNIMAGFVGGAGALAFVYPLDFATIRMAAELRQAKRQRGLLETLNSTQRRHGLAALYRGYGVSATAIGAYKALYFGLYDTACAYMVQSGNGQPSLADRYLIANAVVVTASTVTYPLDVVRKRLVTDTALTQRQYNGFVDCVAKVARTEGLRGFYRFYGYDMLLRLGGGVLLVLYDELKAHGVRALTMQALMHPTRRYQEQGSAVGDGDGSR